MIPKRLVFAGATILLLLSTTSAADDAAGSCVQSLHAQQLDIINQRAVQKFKSLLSDCGLGDLLNNGLGRFKGLTGAVDGCNRPIDAMVFVVTKQAEGEGRRVEDAVHREINKRLSNTRDIILNGKWY
ncbi:MAG: hypothetical protein CVV05_00600 [Gammaproteobacteria bacterium HGW-Gammaproteobacteria-1]|jgi:hypothetical protein|nr:MAG: hypothetical protein CVV05_00600 [Gammaproteobacteria bacterium HGW-Gammaproteobacteria-1]